MRESEREREREKGRERKGERESEREEERGRLYWIVKANPNHIVNVKFMTRLLHQLSQT